MIITNGIMNFIIKNHILNAVAPKRECCNSSSRKVLFSILCETKIEIKSTPNGIKILLTK